MKLSLSFFPVHLASFDYVLSSVLARRGALTHPPKFGGESRGIIYCYRYYLRTERLEIIITSIYIQKARISKSILKNKKRLHYFHDATLPSQHWAKAPSHFQRRIFIGMNCRIWSKSQFDPMNTGALLRFLDFTNGHGCHMKARDILQLAERDLGKKLHCWAEGAPFWHLVCPTAGFQLSWLYKWLLGLVTTTESRISVVTRDIT